jgi:hypothetical protein
MKVYVASSWRNPIQDVIVITLRNVGHEVYDFKNPRPGNTGFSWREIEPGWEHWSARQFRSALGHPIAVEGFGLDMAALRWCEACVLVLPCGRSAHMELGWACGAGKRTIALVMDEVGPHEPELMYSMLDAVCLSIHEMIEALR